MSSSREAATAEVQNLFFSDEATADSEQDPVEQTDEEAAAPEGEEQETAEFTLDPEVPEDIQALVDEPDFEAEAEAALDEGDDDDQYGEFDDPRLVEERRLRLAAEAKAAHYEKLRAQDASKTWAEEAEKFFPLADVARISATSRRGFLRAAKADHEVKKPFVLKAVETAKAELQSERDKIRAEVRAEMEAAWGHPLTAGNTPAEVKEQTDAVDQAFRTRGLAAGVKEMLRQGQ